MSKRDLRVSIQKQEVRIQPQVAKLNTELRSPHPHRFEVSSSDTPAMDLRDYLTWKRRVQQITLQCDVSS